MVKYLLFLFFVGQSLFVNAQRRISLSEMRSFINLSVSTVDDMLLAGGYEKDVSYNDGTIGDWGVLKNYLDQTNTRLSITINKKVGLIKAVRIYKPDQLHYQRILNHMETGFSQKLKMKKFDVGKETHFADLWKESYPENKVIISFRKQNDLLPYEIEIARDINYTSIEK